MPIRILFLEDDSADFELIVEHLRLSGLVLEVVRARSRAEFEFAFADGAYALALADYSIPGYSGFAALQHVRERDSVLPFILISGALSEEHAVEGLKAGATDYIIKQRLNRLAPAIRRALDEAAERRELLRAQGELREVEAQLLRAQRIQTIGDLSGGIAHDLNNGLSPITMAAELLSDDVHTESGRRMLELVRMSAKRCADMVRQILSFSRGSGHGRELLDPARIVDELADLARETFPRLITIKTQVEPDLRLFDGNITQIHQVIMNLLVNARDAIAHTGTISIVARNVDLRHRRNAITVEPANGPYISISVKDSGAGIAPEIVDKIFEPFFTTKEIGKGTGLGLSTVFSIVKSHGGFLELQSQLGEGTTFELFFPAIVHKPDAVTAPEIPTLTAARGERLLLIDDEEGLLAILKTTLQTLGYEVAAASGGLEAIKILESAERKFDLVLTDWVMPLLCGPELVKKIHALSPGTRILVATGSGGLDHRTVQECRIAGVIAKPYTTATLLAAINAAVNRPAAEQAAPTRA